MPILEFTTHSRRSERQNVNFEKALAFQWPI